MEGSHFRFRQSQGILSLAVPPQLTLLQRNTQDMRETFIQFGHSQHINRSLV